MPTVLDRIHKTVEGKTITSVNRVVVFQYRFPSVLVKVAEAYDDHRYYASDVLMVSGDW